MKLKKEKVMLVDSSDNLRHVIKDYLEMSGYDVIDYNGGLDANKSFNKGLFDICIIDVALKNYDGFKLLQNMRKLDKNVPIIILSSYTSKESRIKGFNLGCDDYITKPFSIEELGLRMQAILRRCQNNAPREYVNEDESIKFGNFTLNYTEMQLIHPKITRTLTRKECIVLTSTGQPDTITVIIRLFALANAEATSSCAEGKVIVLRSEPSVSTSRLLPAKKMTRSACCAASTA